MVEKNEKMGGWDDGTVGGWEVGRMGKVKTEK